MLENIFQIEKLKCSYNRKVEDTVFYVEQLNIPKGKLIFLLGASGSGKSTLLETLGLMNNTLADGKIILNAGGQEISYATLWKDEQKLSEIRKDYFSFIFQNTNLMENFTAYENVCLSQMIKEDKTQREVLDSAKLLMEKVKLPQNEVGLQALSVNLSGGQRQRVSFVRALNTNFSVLFCDEPTGNLDESNANELLNLIKGSLDETKTALIVSHDINLAVRHADQIIVITKDLEKGYGEILPENIFNRESWGQSEQAGNKLRDEVKNLYKSNLDHVKGKDGGGDKSNIDRSYSSLFFRKETKALFGKKYVNFIVLCVLFFFTFLAIGFANGSLNYLNKKLNSAFVNWLTVTIPSSRNSKEVINPIKDSLDNPDNLQKYSYQNVSMYIEPAIYVWDFTRKGFLRTVGRSVDVKNDKKLLDEDVFNPKNLISKESKPYESEYDIGVVVTERLLKEFNYAPNANFIYIRETSRNDSDANSIVLSVPVPVKAIVENLPGQNQILFTEYYYKMWKARHSPFEINHETKKILLFVKSDSLNTYKIQDEITKTVFPKYIDNYKPICDPILKHSKSFAAGYDISIDFLTLPSYDTYNAIVDDIKKLPTIKNTNISVINYYNYNMDVHSEVINYDAISIFFSKLNKVRDFSKFVFSTFNTNEENDKIIVDINKVKDKENFEFISTISLIVAYLLVLFGAISVGLFLLNLLKMHLNKVKMNIGTYKAIGLGDKVSRNIYFLIISGFLIVGMSVSFILALGVGTSSDIALGSYLSVEGDTSYFQLFDFNTLVTVIFIMVSSLAISWYTISKILSKSPGDLIYNR